MAEHHKSKSTQQMSRGDKSSCAFSFSISSNLTHPNLLFLGHGVLQGLPWRRRGGGSGLAAGGRRLDVGEPVGLVVGVATRLAWGAIQ